MNARFWQNIKKKGKVTWDSFLKFPLRQQLFAFRKLCMEKRLSNHLQNYKRHEAGRDNFKGVL